jgi:alkanesulfonate monooxygenase SsuD/methylene tetrahydromethanopterin reductase-like flavin-dependent oxidoreductase (luciferase family)
MQVFIYSPRMHAPELAVEEALRIEDLGYDGIAMPDHLFVPNFNTGLPQSLRPWPYDSGGGRRGHEPREADPLHGEQPGTWSG